MTEKYIVTATGIKDNTPYAILSRVISGVKDNGDVFEFADSKTTKTESEQIPLGTYGLNSTVWIRTWRSVSESHAPDM